MEVYLSKLTITILLLILPLSATATTHFVYYDGKVIYIASDSGNAIVSNDGKRSHGTICKAFTGKTVAFIGWGHPADKLIEIGPGSHKARIVNNFDAEVVKILDRPQSNDVTNIDSTFTALAAQAKSKLAQAVAFHDQMQSKEPHWHYGIGGLLVWMENGVPKMRRFDASVADWEHRVITLDSKPVKVPDLAFMYQFPDDSHQVVQTAAGGFGYADWAAGADKVLAHALDVVAQPPNERNISRPYTIVHLSRFGITWDDPSAVCKRSETQEQ
jgi:hypothetical protein